MEISGNIKYSGDADVIFVGGGALKDLVHDFN